MSDQGAGRVDPPGPGERDPYGTGRYDTGTSVRARSSVGREVAFGPGVLVAAVAVVVLLLATVLPWVVTPTLSASGWDVVRGAPGISVLPRLFGILALAFGALGTALSVLTRRWVVVFVTAAGSTVTTVTGLWAVWSQNTAGGQGPGAGLVLALVATAVLAFRWAGYALSRE